ncbi:hypothetical protein M2271_002503 [Streptomyces sp. LBL]|nr:hypothetical protein [Streptomyces sp. LBL]
MERWADEQAATVVGDRAGTALVRFALAVVLLLASPRTGG